MGDGLGWVNIERSWGSRETLIDVLSNNLPYGYISHKKIKKISSVHSATLSNIKYNIYLFFYKKAHVVFTVELFIFLLIFLE